MRQVSTATPALRRWAFREGMHGSTQSVARDLSRGPAFQYVATSNRCERAGLSGGLCAWGVWVRCRTLEGETGGRSVRYLYRGARPEVGGSVRACLAALLLQ